jgi:hypothetical protein
MEHGSMAVVSVPPLDADVHLVLCDFGPFGIAYVETDPAEADAITIVETCFIVSTTDLCGS